MSLIGLDVGTTGCKAIVFDHMGRILGQGAREYAIAFPCPGWAEQDAALREGRISVYRHVVPGLYLAMTLNYSGGLLPR